MPIRRQSSNILYPFTPDAETSRNAVSGVVDAFFVIKGVGTPGPVGSPITKPYYAALYSLVVTDTTNTYVFYANAPDGYWQVLTFEVPRNSGIVRVAANEDSFSFLVINTDIMYDTIGSNTAMWVELEPSRVLFQLDEIRSIRLTNEYRDHDTRIRSQSIDDNPDTTVIYLDGDDDTLSLVDGYNCTLSYDEDTETLTVFGGAGLGKGLPVEFPWDSDAIDVFTGIKSINAQNVDGNLEITFGESIRPEYNTSSLTMHVMED